MVPPTLDLGTFISRWQASTLSERSGSQPHFLDLCAVLGERGPAEADIVGESYAFERGAHKTSGGDGWADVWKRGCFGWEYKGKHKDLKAAYQQLLQYREDLENPPLLVVCDFNRFEVHTNFTGTVKQVYAFTLADLAQPVPTPTCVLPPLQVLRALFTDPGALRPQHTTAQVTEQAAAEFAHLADSLRNRGVAPDAAAHFLMRLLFCLFAEDIGLLPAKLFSHLVVRTINRPEDFASRLSTLFAAMASGGSFGVDDIAHFNGGLFADSTECALSTPDLAILSRAAALDWASIEPAIFGTLFERSLDPDKRSQLGAHYTSREDIRLVVEPVLMAPLRRRWVMVQEEIVAVLAKRDAAPVGKRAVHQNVAQRLLMAFSDGVAAVRVLDPACGSGNFLYMALKGLLDLWKEVALFAASHGLQPGFPYGVGPTQLLGLELNAYAHELASVVVWIGYIQWLHDNGYGIPQDPILRPLHTIYHVDALLDGAASELSATVWPEADVIIGNPPFLGGKRLRSELGDDYVDKLFALYDGRVPREADLVCYWFERARALIEAGQVRRAGLLGTQAIRGGANRKVLEHIKASGNIFMAWSDREWILDGAAVHVSMVGFDNGSERDFMLNGAPTAAINANLTGALDLTRAVRLVENAGIAFMGDTKGGSFDVDDATARRMVSAPVNPNGCSNADVVLPWVNGLDVTRRPRNMWIIDFGVDMSIADAALYELPFANVERLVQLERSTNKRASYRERWWIHAEPRPAMRKALAPLSRFIATPNLTKHRLFAWLTPPTVPDHQLIVFARSDDYFFGVLQSRVHELWARGMGTQLREVESGFRYTSTTTFETFPLPWRPGAEPWDDPRLQEIARAAVDLAEKRERWLNPPGTGLSERARRTLTVLYNDPPAWLRQVHDRLDAAVLAAYGWPLKATDNELLAFLLGLNQERGGLAGSVAEVRRAETTEDQVLSLA